MSKATKRKHVTKEVLDDYVVPEPNQQIVKVRKCTRYETDFLVSSMGSYISKIKRLSNVIFILKILIN